MFTVLLGISGSTEALVCSSSPQGSVRQAKSLLSSQGPPCIQLGGVFQLPLVLTRVLLRT